MMQRGVEKLQVSHMLICLGLGSLSGFIAGWANVSYMGITAPLYFLRPSFFTIFVVSVIAPLVEEPIKPLGLYLLKEEEKISLALRDWILLGALAGLGFGLLENGLYALQAVGYGTAAALALLGLRTLISLPMHTIATTMSGFGIGLWAKTGDASYFLRFLVLAMLIHGSYNFIVTGLG